MDNETYATKYSLTVAEGDRLGVETRRIALDFALAWGDRLIRTNRDIHLSASNITQLAETFYAWIADGVVGTSDDEEDDSAD